MNRRNFIGSVIGTLVVPQLPFRAILADLDPIRLPNGKIQEGQVAAIIYGPNGDAIWAPPISEHLYTGSGLVISTEKLEVNRPLTVTGLALVNHNHQIIRRMPFDSDCQCKQGDNVSFLLRYGHVPCHAEAVDHLQTIEIALQTGLSYKQRPDPAEAPGETVEFNWEW